LRDIKAALAATVALADDRDTWLAIGMAVHAGTGGSLDGLSLWDDWSRNSAKYERTTLESSWNSFKPTQITVGTLFHHATCAQPGWRAPSWDGDLGEVGNEREHESSSNTERPSLALLDRAIAPCPDLPLSAFGDFWSQWIGRAAEGANAPPDYTAIPLLAAAASLVGNARWVRIWDGWEEPPTLWCAAVGAPSSGKSPGAAPIMGSALRIVEARISRDYPSRRDAWVGKEVFAAALRKKWEQDVAVAAEQGTPPPPMPDGITLPPEPVEPCARVGSVTVEKLASILASQPKGLLCYNDEPERVNDFDTAGVGI
jgi:hypothetical protein